MSRRDSCARSPEGLEFDRDDVELEARGSLCHQRAVRVGIGTEESTG